MKFAIVTFPLEIFTATEPCLIPSVHRGVCLQWGLPRGGSPILIYIIKVANVHEARDFLAVSTGTVLKVKAGLLTLDGPTTLVLNTWQGKRDTVKILMRLTFETVSSF